MRSSLRVTAWHVFIVMVAGHALAQKPSSIGSADWTAVISLTGGSQVRIDLVSASERQGVSYPQLPTTFV